MLGLSARSNIAIDTPVSPELTFFIKNGRATRLHDDLMSIFVNVYIYQMLKRQVLFREEIEAVREVLGETPRLAGFYSYGEISPLGTTQCELHNQTMTITTPSESHG